eukprot:TRINITY_DN3262_c0_g1_i12.p2 TRINITY_DN3262_c0_g1~~TRINITY_DN3262_c0_g1_i12.p2  ORF type:complete len:65 (-),score=8.35 TRINITY_DN3262_c0_g1_i12:46-240(-)
MIMFVRIFFSKDIVPICFYRFVDIVMVLTYFCSQNTQIELATVRCISIKCSFFLKSKKPFSLLQ